MSMDNMGAERLVQWFSARDGAVIAFSGGVDSTFLLACAKQALGDRAVAITVTSAFFPQWEQSDAREYAESMGARHVELQADVMGHDEVMGNGERRCYYCKLLVFGMIKQKAEELGIATVCDGTNADDEGDYRPGEQAARELGIHSPLRLLGYTKREIRECSAAMGLQSASKPAYACLATRIPTGEAITEERLRRVEQAENYLHDLGFWNVRVRDHGELARIEVAGRQMKDFLKQDLAGISEAFTALGYRFAALDLAGYKKGSMNARDS